MNLDVKIMHINIDIMIGTSKSWIWMLKSRFLISTSLSGCENHEFGRKNNDCGRRRQHYEFVRQNHERQNHEI